jgi:hypothetical protein
MVVYGHQVKSEGDRYIEIADEVRSGAVKLPAGTVLVDAFPLRACLWIATGKFLEPHLNLVKYTPSWFPGGSFQNVARQRRKLTKELREAPYEMVKERMVLL